jgi:3'(2'), 5'-bisphosphate nucleotidase
LTTTTGPGSERHADAGGDDHLLAARLASEAGALLVALRDELVAAGADAATLKTEGDRRANDLLLAGLAERIRAGDAVLSEEAKDDPVRLERARVWIVDPLDGTREFSEPPRRDWAVHVALTVGGRPVAGAVALPALGEVLATAPAAAPPPPMPGRPRVIVSRSRPPAAATWLAEQLDAELVEMGSAGAKAMAVLRGEADVYAHSGGQYEWDSCAPVAVALAAGLHASRIDGTPLTYNNPDPYLPDLLICRSELAGPALEALRAFPG